MARRKQPETKRRQLAASADGLELEFQVDVRELEGDRPLVRIAADDQIWQTVLLHDAWDSTLDPALKGAIVRIDPPIDCDEAVIDTVQSCCERAGALAVRASPRRRSRTLTDQPARQKAHHRAREVVCELVAAANVEDQAALAAFCETVMARVGL
jgi:hypothetical protein